MAHLMRILLVCLVLVALPLTASADPITGFLGSTLFTTAAGTAITVGTAITWVATAVSVVSSVYGSVQAKKQARAAAERKFQQDVANLQDRTAQIVASDDPWPIVYGQPAPIGGSIKAVLGSGDKAQFKHIVIVLAAHECEAIDDVYIDGESLQLDDFGTSRNPTYQLEYGVSRDVEFDFTVERFERINPYTEEVTYIYAALIDTSSQGQIYDPRLIAIKGADGGDLMGRFTVSNPNAVPGAMHFPGVALIGDQSVEGATGKVTLRLDGPGSALHVSKHLSRGGIDVADAIMMNAVPSLWTADHKLSGYTYIVVTLNLLLERFQSGMPAITARVRGKRIFDPRTGQTAYSRNPALCLADFLRSEYGYLALDTQIDQNALIAAANACDVVAYGPEAWGDRNTYGNDARLYVCDGMFRSDQDRDTTRQQLEDAMAGYSLESGGVWRILAGSWATPVLALSDDDMLKPSAVIQTANPGQSRFNGARGVYVNAGRNGVSEDITPYVNAVFRDADQKEKWLDLPLSFTASHARTHQLARTRVEQSRGGLVLQIFPKMLAWHLQPGDRIVYTNELYGFENKRFRVQDWAYSPTSPLALQIIEDEPSFYDQADETQADPAPNTNLPSPLLVPDPPFDVTVRSGPEEMVLQGGTMVVRAHVTWGLSNSAAVRMGGSVRIQWRTVLPVGEWQTMDLQGDAIEAYILGLGVATEYQVRVRFQTSYVQSSWVTVDHTVTGKGDRPADVNGLALALGSDGIVASWNQPAGLDLLDWSTTSIRIGATWELAEEVFAGKATSTSLGWRQAGTLRVWASHSSTSGDWSVPVSASIQIDPPLQPVVTADVVRNSLRLAWQDCKATQPLSFYLVSRGPTLASSTEVARPTDRQLARTEEAGTRLYWVRAVDAGGNAGPAGYVQATILASIDEALGQLEEGLQEAVDELKHADAIQISALDQEIQDRANALLVEVANRNAAISQAASDLTAAIGSEAQQRQAADIAEAQQRQQQTGANAAAIAAEAADRAAAMVDEANARAAALGAEASARTQAIAAEATLRANAITQEQNARAAALIAEADARGTAIASEASSRQQADSALSTRVDTVTANLGTTAAALQTEQTARANGDAAEATARQQLATQLQNADASLAASILQEASTRSAADSAEARTREALAVSLTGMEAPSAALQDVQGASLRLRFASEVFQAWQTLTLTSVGGLIAQERQARLTADAAEVSARETMQAQLVGGYDGSDLTQVTSGLLAQERFARASQDEALAQQITLISAGVGEQFDPSKIWYFDSGVEDWTGNGAPTASAGWLRPANHPNDPYVVSPAALDSAGSTYSQMRLRVRKIGAPVWDGSLYWRRVGDAGFDPGRLAIMSEPTYDGAGIGMVTVNPGWDGTVDQIRLDLSQAQAASDYFEIDWVAMGRPSPGASTAALQTEAATRASADAAQVTARETLAAQLRGTYAGNDIDALSSGLLASERNARASADSAEVTARQQLAATVAGNKTAADAAVANEATARATADAAEATARQALGTSLTGEIGTVRADLVAEQTTRAAADSAEASTREALALQMRGNYTGTDLASVTSGLVYSERQARLTADQAEVLERQQLATTVTNNKVTTDAAITAEQSARSTGDQANAQAIEQLSAQMTTANGETTAAIQQEAAARAKADSAEATQRQGLSVALLGAPDVSGTLATVVGPSARFVFSSGAAGYYAAWMKPTGDTLASGLLQEERQARITADSAEVVQREALAATVNTGLSTADANLTTERIARTNADAAEATARETLGAQMRGGYTGTDPAQLSSGLVFNERQTRIAADAAEATQREALAATVTIGLNTAAANLAAEQQARAEADSAQVSAQEALMAQVRGSYGGTDASQVSSGLIYSERQLRIAGDNAEATQRQQLATTVTNNKSQTDAAILAEQSARSTGDQANADQITALTGTVIGNKSAGDAALAAEANVRATADTAEALQRQALSAALVGGTDIASRLVDVVGASMRLQFAQPAPRLGVWLPPSLAALSAGLVAEERTARATADAANAQAIVDVSARLTNAETGVSGNASAISGLQTSVTSINGTLTSQATQIGGLTTRVTNAETGISGNATAISNLSTSVTSIDGRVSSQATQISGLSTSVGNNTAAITNQATALATLTGQVKATWRLNVDANGKVAGMILDNDGSTSNMVVLVDKFAIAQTGPGNTTKYPFIVGTVNGAPSIGISGDMYVDGSIKTRMLDARAVTADKIDVFELSAIAANVGLLRTRSYGARIEIESNQIRVYDSNNVLRVRLGEW